jgi:presenilin-like A22 family membrane protease
MKHKLPVTLILVTVFLLTQIIGLYITKQYLTEELPLGMERPEFKETTSYIPLLTGILIATILAFMIIKFGALRLWKIWFFLASAYLLTIAFGAIFTSTFALFLGITFTAIRFVRPSVIIHNFSELFVYSGIAAIFVPIMSVLAAAIMLLIISIYDMIAVWKTKHMIKLAKFQTKSNMFAGLFIPYKKGKTIRAAILGGGDIGFPMIFAGVVMKSSTFLDGFIVAIFVSLTLFALLIFGKEKEFYPAMPFLTIGCALGYAVSLLI